MKNTRLENACKGILQRWDEGKEFQETQIYIIQEELMKGQDGKLPESYYALYRRLKEMWHYQEIDMKPRESFLAGSIWSCMEMQDLRRRNMQEGLSIGELAIKYKGYEWFFAALYQQPGLKHAELARKGRKTPSELSQFAARIAKENLYTDNRIGREKYYFLSERGERLLKEIQKSHVRKQEFGMKPYVKKIDEKNEMVKTAGTITYSPIKTHLIEYFISQMLNTGFGMMSVEDRKIGQKGECKSVWQNKTKNLYSNSMNSYLALEEMK